MIPVKAALRVDFSEAMHPWIEIRDTIRIAQGKADVELQGPPIVAVRADRHQRVTLQVRGLAVEQEGRDAGDGAFSRIFETVQQIAAQTRLPSVAAVRFDQLTIDPFELPFAELVAHLKALLLVPHPLVNRATDVQVATDEQVDDQTMNHIQIGPMRPAQLNADILAIRREKLPDQFVFVMTGRTRRFPAPLSIEDLKTLADPFVQWSRAQTDEILATVRTA